MIPRRFRSVIVAGDIFLTPGRDWFVNAQTADCGGALVGKRNIRYYGQMVGGVASVPKAGNYCMVSDL